VEIKIHIEFIHTQCERERERATTGKRLSILQYLRVHKTFMFMSPHNEVKESW